MGKGKVPKSYYLEESLTFSDRSLKSGWANRLLKIKGDTIVGFMGPFRSFQYNRDFENVLHIVIEHKGLSVREAETRRRLFACLLCHLLGEGFSRKGDEIMFYEKQLSLSELRVTFQSSVLHFSLFNISEDSILPIIGLDAFDISPKDFALTAMRHYCDEMDGILSA